MLSCLASPVSLLHVNDNQLFDMRSATSLSGPGVPSSSALDWAFLPAHLLDAVILNLTSAPGTDLSAELKALFAVVGTCSAWREVGMPALLAKMWKHKKVVHFKQLFTTKPHDSSPQVPPMLRCVIKRNPSTSPLDNPSYELWQAESERDMHPRFLLSARVNKHSNFTISVNRAASSSSSSSSPLDSECAELITNIKRTEYELHWCRKRWVQKACMQPGSSKTHDAGGSAASPGVWQQRLSSFKALLGLKVTPEQAQAGLPLPEDPPPPPLLYVRYFMRMHGLLLPRRLVVEVAQPPPPPPPLSTNPLFNATSPSSSCDLDAVKDQDQDQAQGRDQKRPGSSSGSSKPALLGMPSQEAPKAAVAPEPLRLQNVLPHWSPQLKCWCLNFNNRVKLPSIKNFQLGVVTAGGASVQSEEGRPVQQPVLLQFGKVDTDVFVLDFQPTAMTAVQAFGMGLSSFERKYSLY